MLALIELAFHAGEEFHDEFTLDLAAAEGASHTSALLAMMWESRTNSFEMRMVAVLLASAFLILPAVHNGSPTLFL